MNVGNVQITPELKKAMRTVLRAGVQITNAFFTIRSDFPNEYHIATGTGWRPYSGRKALDRALQHFCNGIDGGK